MSVLNLVLLIPGKLTFRAAISGLAARCARYGHLHHYRFRQRKIKVLKIEVLASLPLPPRFPGRSGWAVVCQYAGGTSTTPTCVPMGKTNAGIAAQAVPGLYGQPWPRDKCGLIEAKRRTVLTAVQPVRRHPPTVSTSPRPAQSIRP